MEFEKKQIKKLQKSINALICGVRIGKYLKSAQEEINALMEINNYRHKAYDSPEKASIYIETQDLFESAYKNISNIFGNAVYDEAYQDFVTLLNSKDLTKELFGVDNIENPDDVFYNALIELKTKLPLIDVDQDGFTFWVNIIKLSFSQEKIKEIQSSLRCPICGMPSSKIPSAIYLGDSILENDAFVYVCENCDLYAYADKQGNVVGTLADKGTHKKRGLVKKCIGEMSDLKGWTLYESFSWAKKISQVYIKNYKDIEKLSAEDCNKILNNFLTEKEQYQQLNYNWPKTHKDFMKFLESGGRLKICRSLNEKENGKLLIPIEVGETAFKVKTKSGSKKYEFPKCLDMTFKGQMVEIIHPSKKVEIYQMYPI